MSHWRSLDVWVRSLIAALVSGAANGVVTGFAAIGIDPSHFNLQAGFRHTFEIAGTSAIMSAMLGVAAFLQKSPLPPTEDK